MFEEVKALINEECNVSRQKATLWIIALTFILGVVCSMSIGPWKDHTVFGLTIFDLFDYVSANILLPGGGLLISLYVGYRLDRKIMINELTNDHSFRIWYFKPLIFAIRYIAPVAIILIFLSGLGVI